MKKEDRIFLCKLPHFIIRCEMKYILLLALLLYVTGANAQVRSSDDSVDIYIARLNWNSFGDNGQYVRKLVLGGDANWLIRQKSHGTIDKLIAHLADSEKTAVIHQILIRLFDGEDWSFSEDGIRGKGSSFSVIYTFSGLTWMRDSLWRPVITREAISHIQQYWQRRYYPKKIEGNPPAEGDRHARTPDSPPPSSAAIFLQKWLSFSIFIGT